MHYISTRGGAAALDFQGATLTGLASDGGLYLPESWPTFSREDIAALAGLSYVETAVRVMLPFVGDSLDEEELRDLCKQAYGSFSHQGVTPLVQLDRSEEHTSELQSLMRISYAVFCLKKKKTPAQYKH